MTLIARALLLPLLAAGQDIPVVNGPFTVRYSGYEYRTMLSGVSVTDSTSDCHPSSNGVALPSGYEIAPNTDAIITHVVARFMWQCSVLVLYSSGGFDNYYPAYRTGRTSSPGQNFGDSQAKARNYNGLWVCPWTCYNILIRKPSDSDVATTTVTLCSGSCSYASDGDCDVSPRACAVPVELVPSAIMYMRGLFDLKAGGLVGSLYMCVLSLMAGRWPRI